VTHFASPGVPLDATDSMAGRPSGKPKTAVAAVELPSYAVRQTNNGFATV